MNKDITKEKRTILDIIFRNQERIITEEKVESLLDDLIILAITKTKEEMISEIIKYQNGFVRDDGFGNSERAPEWGVIDDLLINLTK